MPRRGVIFEGGEPLQPRRAPTPELPPLGPRWVGLDVKTPGWVKVMLMARFGSEWPTDCAARAAALRIGRPWRGRWWDE